MTSSLLRLKITPRACLAAVLAALASTAAAEPATAGFAADEHYVFDVLREGAAIGTHEVRLDHAGDTTRAHIDTRLRVRFLGFTLYRLDYESSEVWTGDRLKTLHVAVNRDGEALTLSGHQVNGAFELTAGDDTRRMPTPPVPTNHWNPEILEQDAVLNTLTGQMNQVSIRKVGEESLTLAGNTVPATRYRFEGELRLESWYDETGRWLAMTFEAEDGSTIEYRCRNCADRDG